MGSVRKHRDIKLVTTEARRNYLMSEPNYHTTMFFVVEILSATEMKKIFNPQIFMNRPVYLGLSIIEISKIVMYEFWYYYLKLKYEEKAKSYYMITVGYGKQKTFTQTFQKMLQLDMIPQNAN